MRKEIKTELTKDKILTAAMGEFGTKGYAGASLNNICNAGIAKGLLYHNYASKDALYIACVERSFRLLTECLKSAEIGTDLHRYTEVRLRFFREHEPEARLFFESILQPPAVLKTDIAKARQEFNAFNQGLCQNMIDSVKLRSDVTAEDAMRYFKLMQEIFNGYFSAPALGDLSFADTMATHEAGLSKFLDFMLYGIAERSEK